MHPSVHSNTDHNSQDMEITYMSINRWMDTEDMVHTYNETLLNNKKKNEILPFTAT